jgi:SRSO17 transposase
MGAGLEARFERYCDVLLGALMHIDRHQPARWYMQALMLSGGRKSIEPMAARINPGAVSAAHQSMHHFIAKSDWHDETLLNAVADMVIPALTQDAQACNWIIDDTGIPKKGQHSVGVSHQYCGQLGKTENCQVAVSLTLATKQGSLPLAYQLYLPQSWTDDTARCQRAGVPESIPFSTKGQIARAQISAALAAGVPSGPILADAAYGDETAFRDWLTAQGLPYALGVRPATTVWWAKHQPVAHPAVGSRGKPRKHLVRDVNHQPISVQALAHTLPQQLFRQVSWREGSQALLSSRFARVRVCAAHRDHVREEEWLVIEWPPAEASPTRYWLSTLPASVSQKALIDTIKARWRIERDYQELKQEFGLGQYEGRNWRGFHHHASLCIAAYGFLMRERLSGVKKNAARFKQSALPEGYWPRGSRANATTSAELDCNATLPLGARHRNGVMPVSVLRQDK